ncbi:MAG TPA: TetR/AcrR family transcriptional regulator [Herpetosiphonaceae bacterium]|nr:TetR/AcrR family transcriptional regulator [Herpetosiphonaceae bacterium]
MARPREFSREAALAKAMNLFWKQGYEATSVQDLGAQLGLNPGSLYNAFKDKHSLFLEALDHYSQTQGEQCAQLLGQASGKAALRQFFMLSLETSASDPERKGCLMVNSAAELGAHDPEVRARVRASRAYLRAQFQRSIEQGQAAGEISRRRDPALLAEFLVNSLYGLMISTKMLADHATLMQIVDITLQVLD